MRKSFTILVFLAVTLSVSGCDLFRALVGRPTSAEIAEKEALIKYSTVFEASAADSLAVADSLAEQTAQEAVQTVNETPETSVVEQPAVPQQTAAPKVDNAVRTVPAGNVITDDAKSGFQHQYCIVVGSFSSIENANRLVARIKDSGYRACTLKCRSGFTAVGVEPADSYQEIRETLTKIRTESFCPADAWILENK